MPRLLSSVDQIDAQWLQDVFSEAGKTWPDVANLRIEPIGHGNSAETIKAAIEYKAQSDAPASLVCKLHSSISEVFEATRAAGIFTTEANTWKLFAAGCEAAIPELYFVGVAEDGSEFNLVCEDLSIFCELGDQIAGCSIKQAEAAVMELAKMHRQFWHAPVLKDLSWIKPRLPLPANALDLMQDRFDVLLNAEQYKVVQQSAPLVQEWLQRQPANRTLIHTDCRVDNILFDSRDANAPRAYLIDFALTNIGDAADDLAYFLTSSLSPEDRLACEMDLLKLHTEEIAKKDPTYTIEKAIEAYRANIVSSLYLTLIATMGMADTPHKRLLLSKLFERNCAAVEHWVL